MRRLATLLSGLAFLVAGAAVARLLTIPVYAGVRTSAGPGAESAPPERVAATLAAVNGPWVIALLVAVALLAGLPLLAAFRFPHAQRAATWTAALLMLAFSVITGFSVGPWFWPSTVLLLSAAVVSLFMKVPDAPPDYGSRGVM